VCSVACGVGTQTRLRSVLHPATFGGACDGDNAGTQNCTQPACAPKCTKADCVVTDWTPWSDCENRFGARKRGTCQYGAQTRARTILTPASCGGVSCPSDFTGQQQCDLPECIGTPGYVLATTTLYLGGTLTPVPTTHFVITVRRYHQLKCIESWFDHACTRTRCRRLRAASPIRGSRRTHSRH
jgi:hypothetical protein